MKQVFTMEQIKAMQQQDMGADTSEAYTKRFVFPLSDPTDEDILRVEQKWLAAYFKHTGEKQPLSYRERIEQGDCEE